MGVYRDLKISSGRSSAILSAYCTSICVKRASAFSPAKGPLRQDYFFPNATPNAIVHRAPQGSYRGNSFAGLQLR